MEVKMGIFLTKKNMLRCPKCGGYADKRDGIFICLKCGEDLVPQSEYEGQPLYGSNRSKVTCPYCNSSNVTKISTVDRVVSTGLFGLASSKVGKQWHCNSCKSDF